MLMFYKDAAPTAMLRLSQEMGTCIQHGSLSLIKKRPSPFQQDRYHLRLSESLFSLEIMRNFFGGLILAFSFQQAVWTVLDFSGLEQYGSEGWPYTLNPVGGGIVAVVAFVGGLIVVEKRPSISRAMALGLAVFSGYYFWLLRRPADPYMDYGSDNFLQMFTNLILIAAVLVVVCAIEFMIRRKAESNSLTEQACTDQPATAPQLESKENENPNPVSKAPPQQRVEDH